MNNLINLIILWIGLFYGNILFKNINDSLTNKLINFLISCLNSIYLRKN